MGLVIEADASQLEWRTAVFQSQDKVGMEELWNGVDIHTRNQGDFELPDRLTAKKFLFRAIYRGPAYAYANDPEFMHVSKSEKFWQGVIDRMYEKYYGLAAWHERMIREVNRTGLWTIATGRTYEFKRNERTHEYPERDIANWPNQGLGAELMALARVCARRRYQTFVHRDKFIFVNTVHDSMLTDSCMVPGSRELYDTLCWFEDIFTDLPRNFEKVFGVEFNIPLAGECKYGPTWGDMTTFKRNEYDVHV